MKSKRLKVKHLPLLYFTLLAGCGDDTPTAPVDPDPEQPIFGITAPEIIRPDSGSEVGVRPTLVAGNASEDAATVYTFQVSRNPDFDGLVTASGGVPVKPNGRAVWQVPFALEDGEHFWRAQAHLGRVDTPYSNTASFVVNSNQRPEQPDNPDPPPTPTPPTAGIVVDPLTDGTSSGQVSGGRFTDEGWEVTSHTDFIRYEIGTLTEGYVEWENTGLAPENQASNNFMLFGMWDPSAGGYRTNPYRVHVQKLDSQHNPPYVRLRWISGGEEHDEGFNFTTWNPNRTYRWRLEWGPEGDGHVVRLSLEDQVIVRVDYSRAYNPRELFVELGIEERRESIVGAVYRNVRIGPR